MVAVIVAVVGIVIFVLPLFAVWATIFRMVGPNQALIVYGLGGTKVVKATGKVVWPLVLPARDVSRELMRFDVPPTQDLYTLRGDAVDVDAVTQIKVNSDPVSLMTAAGQFLQ